jgi:hypothetical protein
MKRLLLILSLATVVLSNRAANAVVPQATAARFCQLLVCDTDERIISLQAFLSKNPVGSSDSLTTEQLFFDYVFHYGGWQTLCIFPYCDGQQAHWYAAGSELPQQMPTEHRRYMQEVFVRMQAEVDAERWDVVDAYIDRLLQYQRQFGPVASEPRSASLPISLITALFFVLFLSISFWRRKRPSVQTFA